MPYIITDGALRGHHNSSRCLFKLLGCEQRVALVLQTEPKSAAEWDTDQDTRKCIIIIVIGILLLLINTIIINSISSNNDDVACHNLIKTHTSTSPLKDNVGYTVL